MTDEEEKKEEEQEKEKPEKVTQFIQPEDAFMDVKWTWNPPSKE